MLKKFLSGIIGTVILFCLTTISIAYIAKDILKGPLLMELGYNVISDSFYEVNERGITSYIDLLFAGTSSQYEDIDKYFDEEEIKKELGAIFTDYIKYAAGIPGAEAPSTESLTAYVNQCASNYEVNTGKTIDLTIPNAFVQNLESSIHKDEKIVDAKVQKVLQLIYADNIYTIPIVVMIISVLLLLIINRDLAVILSNLGTSFVINGICTFGLGFGLKTAINKQGLMTDFTEKIIKIFVTHFNKVAIICLVVGILFLASSFIIKMTKKNKVTSNNQFFTYNN